MSRCFISCSISSIFIIGMLYMNWMVSNNNTILQYKNKLSPRLQEIYEKITEERLQIYYQGYILGFILSIILIMLNKRYNYKLTSAPMICIILSVSFLTNYFYYILSPKKNWMLDYIKTPDETKAWLEMYRAMQLYYHGGLVLGIIAVSLFTFGFCK